MIQKKFSCLLCGKRRAEEGSHVDGDNWGSWLILMPSGHVFTICPACRTKPINEVYKVVLELQERELSSR